MKWLEIKDKNEAELQKLVESGRAELVDLRFKAGSGALKQVHQIAKLRKQLARFLTRLGQITNSKH